MYDERHQAIINIINRILAFFAVISFFVLILLSGFYLKSSTIRIFNVFINIQILFYIGQEIYRCWITRQHMFAHARDRILEITMAVLLLFYVLIPSTFMHLLNNIFPSFRADDILLIYLALSEVFFLLVILRKLLKFRRKVGSRLLHAGRLMMVSFFLLIVFGTFLLMTPKCVPYGHSPLDFTSAFFTSTSCVCVTGLSILDISTQVSVTGYTIMLLLMQIGGLGIMTITAMFAMFASGGFSFQMRVMMGNILSEDSLSDVTSLIRQIITYTFSIEFVGFTVMFFSIGGTLTNIDGSVFFTAVFHAIAAFCNAGFSIYPDGLVNANVNSNYTFLSAVIVLKLTGGLGFGTLRNIVHLKPFSSRHKPIRYQLSVTTKLILITTAALIVFGTIVIYLLQPVYPYEYGEGAKLFHSCFMSVGRTCGFNTFNVELGSPSLVLLLALLMAIGASPGSTGGGIKTTTFAIVITAFWRMIQGKERLTMYNREIHREYVRKALMVMFAFFLTSMVAIFFIVMFEPDKPFEFLMFEVVSALSTAGLSCDVTPHLGTASQYLIIILMFIGRIGVLSFFLAFHKNWKEPRYKLPKTPVLIG